VDTRTPTRPQRGRAEGIEAEPGLYTVKVPSDPARLNTTTASFRVRLGAPVLPLIDAGANTSPPLADDTQPLLIVPAFPALVGAGAPMVAPVAAPPRRRPRVTPITWTGGAAPLLDAVRRGGGGSTVLPRQPSGDDTQTLPVVGSEPWADEQDRYAAGYAAGGPLADGLPYPEGLADPEEGYEPGAYDGGRDPAEPVRHAWYPGRRVDLGLVLLPLRLFLGGISIYAGFSKLCDPVYFDGGARGSMMHWLQSLHPWPLARPLLDVALNHPVGSGLAVAFAQIVIGVLSVLGLWQRFAAALAMALAVVLLVTVSWRTAPVYNAPEIIYLAAWSPLLLAGAPLFSLDGRLAIEAWRRLGERAPVSLLRRRVLRRGFVVATVVVGATLLLGSALGAAVRGSRTDTTDVPQSPGIPTDYPSPVWPTLPPTAAAARPKPPAPGSASASPTHHAPARHHSSSTPTAGQGQGEGEQSSSSSSSGSDDSGDGSSSPTSPKPRPHHSSAPTSPPSGGSGVLGGLLG
jgi:uncharacterized membrane protein YphA (DoxX/SURF4 family)